jgi:hypothetical protein
VYQVIVSAGKRGPRDPAGLCAAIIKADPSITQADLDQLVEGCPNPDHGVAYGSMVVFGYSQVYLAERGHELAARSRQLTRDADTIRRTDEAGSEAVAAAARHLGRLGDALRAHAAQAVPGTTATAIPVLRYPNTEQARREERALAAFLHLEPAAAQDIVWVLGPGTAITDPYRRAVYQVISDMVRDGKPIDELTLDWAIAERSLPLRPKDGGATFGERLARVQVNRQEAATIAGALRDQQEHPSPTPGTAPQQGKTGTRRGTGVRGQGHPAGSQLAPVLPLHRDRLPPNGQDPGPRPR